MNSGLAKRLMGNKTLDEFIDERGQEIIAIGKRKNYKFKSITHKNGSVHTQLYPNCSNPICTKK